MKNKLSNRRGFSLAENITVLTILGLMVAILIPAMLNSRNTAKDRVAMRKAVAMYQGILEKGLISSTGQTVRANLQTSIWGADCADIENVFAVDTHIANTCYFTTKDGIQWYIDNNYALIKLKGVKTELNAANLADIRALAADDNNLKVFYITYDINNRQIRMFQGAGALNVSKTRNFIMDN